jgi:hypothetical protein
MTCFSQATIMACFDEDADGQISISEFESRMPEAVRKMLLERQTLRAKVGLITNEISVERATKPKQHFGSSPRFYQQDLEKNGRGRRAQHSSSVATPWRTATWKTVLNAETAERLDGSGIAMGRKVIFMRPYTSLVILSIQKGGRGGGGGTA